VRRNVAVMEGLVLKAEADVGSVSSVKKMLQLFKLPLFGAPVCDTTLCYCTNKLNLMLT